MPDRSLSNIRRLTIALTLFTLVIVVGLLTIGKQKFSYEITNEEMLAQILKADYMVSPEAAKQMLSQNDGKVKFVDLRNKYDFNIGHLEGALNIPTHKLLEDENLDLFNDQSISFILYGADRLAANGPWMVMRKLGYNNFKVLEGGYKGQMADAVLATGDKALYDYNNILVEAEKEISELQKAGEAAPDAPKPEKKKVTVLPKKVEKAVEEEGC